MPIGTVVPSAFFGFGRAFAFSLGCSPPVLGRGGGVGGVVGCGGGGGGGGVGGGGGGVGGGVGGGGGGVGGGGAL